MDVPELVKIRETIEKMFKNQFNNVGDDENGVNQKLIKKLVGRKPNETISKQYLEVIALNFGIEWKSNNSESGDKAIFNSQNGIKKDNFKIEVIKDLPDLNLKPSISCSPPSYSSISPSLQKSEKDEDDEFAKRLQFLKRK